jgi:adenylosuccinate synthase
VEYVTLPGWKSNISKTRTYGELPENCRAYIEMIEERTGLPIEWIGVGPGRESMITKPVVT